MTYYHKPQTSYRAAPQHYDTHAHSGESPIIHSPVVDLTSILTPAALSSTLPATIPFLPRETIFHLLYSPIPLSFINYIRIQPLLVQKQLALELTEVPIQYAALTFFSTADGNLPNLSNLYNEYKQYRFAFKLMHKATVFKKNESKIAFQQHYRDLLLQPSYVKNSSSFYDTILKRTPPLPNAPVQQFLSTVQSFAQCGMADVTRPQWLLLTNIPQDVSSKDIQAIAVPMSGFLRSFALPTDPTTLTKCAFVCFKDATNRDNACTQLNEKFSTWNRETGENRFVTTFDIDIKASQHGGDDDEDDDKKEKKKNAKKQGVEIGEKHGSVKKHKIRAYQWVSQSQYQLDFDARNTSSPVPGVAKSIHHRQPIVPVGIKQWTSGPIPYSLLMPRITTDIEQATLIAQFFDYIHLLDVHREGVQVGGVEQCLQLFDVHHQYLKANATPAATNVMGSTPSGTDQFNLFRLKFIIKYLREVHFYDYFTTTLYQSLSALQQDIGEEWYIMDPPEYTQQQYHFITQLLHNEHYIAQKMLTTKDRNDINPQYLPVLNAIAVDTTLEPQQYFITAYYNAIFSMVPRMAMPHLEVFPEHSPPTDPVVHHNFWLLAHYYRTVYANASFNKVYNDTSTQLYAPNTYIEHHNQFSATSQPSSRLQTASSQNTLQHIQLPPKEVLFPTLTARFWGNLDEVSNQIKALFQPESINRTTTPSVDVIDPDLYIIRGGLLPSKLTLAENPSTHSDATVVASESTSQTLYADLGIISVAQTLNDVNYLKNKNNDDATDSLLDQLYAPHTANKTIRPNSNVISPASVAVISGGVSTDLNNLVQSTIHNNPLQAVIEPIVHLHYFTQRAPHMFQCNLCAKVLNGVNNMVKHLTLQHNIICSSPSIMTAQAAQHAQIATSTIPPPPPAMAGIPPVHLTPAQQQQNILNKALMDPKFYLDNALVLSETLLYQLFLADQLASATPPTTLTHVQKYLFSSTLTHIDQSCASNENYDRALSRFKKAFASEDILYKRDGKLSNTIDKEWEMAVMVSEKVSTALRNPNDDINIPVDNNLANLHDNNNENDRKMFDNDVDHAEKEHERLEKLKDDLKERYGLAQLFKGIDSDNLGVAKDFSQTHVEWDEESFRDNNLFLIPQGVQTAADCIFFSETAVKQSTCYKNIEIFVQQQVFEQMVVKPAYYGDITHITTMAQYDPYKYF